MKTMENIENNILEKDLIDEININILLSKNPLRAIEIINEHINKKNPFVKVYILALLNRDDLDKEISLKINELVLNYISNFSKDPELLYDYLLFIFNNNLIGTLKREDLVSYIEIVFNQEENYDKLYDFIIRAVKNDSSNIIYEKLIDLFLERLSKDNVGIYYVKKLVNYLDSNSKLDELEYVLSKAIKYYKVVWIVDRYSVLLNKKEKIEKIVEMLVNLLIQNEFNVIWAEALGVIDKAITKADNLTKIISKIITILPSIKLLAEDKKNLNLILKIYSKIFENLDNLDDKSKLDAIKNYVSILEIAKSKNLIDIYDLSKHVITNLNKFSNPDLGYSLIKEILLFLNSEDQKILLNNSILNLKLNELVFSIILNNYRSIDIEPIKDKILNVFQDLLNKTNLYEYKELVYYFFDKLYNEIALNKNLLLLTLKFFIYYNDFENIKKLTKEIIFLNKVNLSDLNDLEVIFIINLILGNYVYVLNNLSNFIIKYPEKLKFVVEFLNEKLKTNPSFINLFNILISLIFTNLRDKEIDLNVDFDFYEYIKKLPIINE